MRPDVDGDQTIGKVSKPALEVWSPLSYCPRSSLPVEVLAWLAGRLAHLAPPRPPGRGGTPPLALEVRLDAVAAVLLDGLSYRRAGRAVGISKTEVGDSLDLLLGELGALGFCQPDGSFVTTLDDLQALLAEMAHSGEVVVVDGLATRVQRPAGWGNQKVLYDAKRHAHTAQGLALSTVWGDLLWCDGGWPGSCHEQELLALSGLACAGWGPSHQGPPQRRAAGVQPLPGGATRAGGAGDRPPRQRLGVAPLARAAVPGPGGVPRRRRAHLPRPLAPPRAHLKKHHGHPH